MELLIFLGKAIIVFALALWVLLSVISFVLKRLVSYGVFDDDEE